MEDATKELIRKMADHLLATDATSEEAKRLARTALANLETHCNPKSISKHVLPDGDPVAEAAKRGANTIYTDSGRTPPQ